VTIESELYAQLTNYGPLTGLINDRVYPSMVPQGVALPYLVYRRVSATRESGFGADIGVVSTRFQLDVVAGSADGNLTSAYSIMREVMVALRGAMQRWHEPSGDPAVMDCLISNEQDVYEDETEFHRGIMDVIVHHRE
jgi:hypothetical protein